jgi:hypothetical protein
MRGGEALSQPPPYRANEPQIRGRERGDQRAQLDFRLTSLGGRLTTWL